MFRLFVTVLTALMLVANGVPLVACSGGCRFSNDETRIASMPHASCCGVSAFGEASADLSLEHQVNKPGEEASGGESSPCSCCTPSPGERETNPDCSISGVSQTGCAMAGCALGCECCHVTESTLVVLSSPVDSVKVRDLAPAFYWPMNQVAGSSSASNDYSASSRFGVRSFSQLYPDVPIHVVNCLWTV